MLNELVELMVDTVCSRREMIRIAGDDYPAEVVKSRFLKLNSSHIEYVLDRMRDNTTYVRNIKKYLLAALYNAPATIDSYYASLVNHDLYGSGETRYRAETRTDSEGNEYEVDVPYTYYICTVELENFDLSHVPVYIMDTETLSMYAVYMSTLGNRSDLFPSSGYVDKYITNPPEDYKIPAEYLSDERFAALISEAEKYLGYPYVWGGSSPSTSFDCSGFVSYVLTNSGLCNTGRLGAQGLYNISTRVSDPQPGDLVFFVGTYDTAGISHVGFYVGLDEAGNPMFLHCGDPIQYARLNTSYWQQHFYAYGRPPYD